MIAYILAINFYAFLLIKTMREQKKETAAFPVKKLWITGALGGAITLYTCMLIMKFKRTDLALMVLMPVLGVLNICLWVFLFPQIFILQKNLLSCVGGWIKLYHALRYSEI